MKDGKKLFQIVLSKGASYVPKIVYIESTSKEHALNAYYLNTMDNLKLYSTILVIDLEYQTMKDPYDNNSIEAEIESDFNSPNLDKVLSYNIETVELPTWVQENLVYFKSCTIIQDIKFKITREELIQKLKDLGIDTDTNSSQIYQALDWAHQAIGHKFY